MYRETDIANAPEGVTTRTASSRAPASPRRPARDAGHADKVSDGPIEDVQARGDSRGIKLDAAGVAGVRYPAMVVDPQGVPRPTVVDVEMSVEVPKESKGTHMSRFLQILREDDEPLAPSSVLRMLRSVQERLESNEARVVMDFPMFMEREAPVSKAKGMTDVDCGFVANLEGDRIDLVQKVAVTVTSLCPCSKEISEYGAHNQRGRVTVEVRTATDEAGVPIPIPTGDLIDAAEESASCRIYPVLKRPDERWVTMEAYENPVFVEDMVRGVASRLIEDQRITWFRVHARNFESIHGHDAFASTTWSR